MSKLAALDQLLEQYQQLSYHTDPALKQRLHEAQDWLKTRILATHQDMFNQKENQLMAKYFLGSYVEPSTAHHATILFI